MDTQSNIYTVAAAEAYQRGTDILDGVIQPSVVDLSPGTLNAVISGLNGCRVDDGRRPVVESEASLGGGVMDQSVAYSTPTGRKVYPVRAIHAPPQNEPLRAPGGFRISTGGGY